MWGRFSAKRDFSRTEIWPIGGNGAWVRPGGAPMTLAVLGVTLCTHKKIGWCKYIAPSNVVVAASRKPFRKTNSSSINFSFLVD